MIVKHPTQIFRLLVLMNEVNSELTRQLQAVSANIDDHMTNDDAVDWQNAITDLYDAQNLIKSALEHTRRSYESITGYPPR